MSSVLTRSELLNWIDNEASQIASGLRDGSISLDAAAHYLDCVRIKIRNAADAAEVDDSEVASPSPATIPPHEFERFTVSPEDSERIEQIRSETYRLAESGLSEMTPEKAIEDGPFADPAMAKHYLKGQLHRCVKAVETGEVKDVGYVRDMALSLELIARELALEPGEFHRDFEAFDLLGIDSEFLALLGVRQQSEPEFYGILQARELDRKESPDVHLVYPSPIMESGAASQLA